MVTKAPVFCALSSIFVCLVACSQSGNTSVEPADLVLINARVYTLAWDDPGANGEVAIGAPFNQNTWSPDAQAVAIKNGRIQFVGTDVSDYRGEKTRVVDLGGATLLPGFVDSHTHVFNLGQALSRVGLFDVDTEAEAVSRVAERAKTVPKGAWIVGQGWDEGAWANRYPDKRLLTEAVPDHPVLMRSLHSFAAWGNQLALDRAGVTASTLVPTGGEIRLGSDGEPNGLFLNRAVTLLEDAVPPETNLQLREQVLKALKQMVADGYVTVHDAGIDRRELQVLQDLNASGELPIRIYAMLSVREEELVNEWLSKGPDLDPNGMLVVRSIKAFYDGALGSRGARLLTDYSDRTGHRGVSGDDYGFNQSLVKQLMHAGFQVGIHAIGDAGNRETLNFLETTFDNDPLAAKGRHRIEHAQILHPLDLPRFGQLGVIASMEPPHAVEDKNWAEDRLGPERVKGAYAWRALRQTGATLIFNSDNPGSDHSIFYGLHSAITRTDKRSEPRGGWYANQAVNADEALRAYTRWPAYAAFREQQTGIIEEGRWADLTAIDVDPLVLADKNPSEILNGQVVLTVIDGKVAYKKE